MTALTVYGTTAASTTLTTANKLYSLAGTPASTFKASLINGATGYGQVYSQGNAGAWAAAGSDGAPDGNGFLWDVTTLEGQTIAAGAWSFTLRPSLTAGAATITADMIGRAYKRSSSGIYTQIARAVTTGVSISTSGANTTVTFTTTSGTDFAVGDKLYIDLWLNITANTNVPTVNVNLNHLSTDTGGLTGSVDSAYVTPGYALTVVASGPYPRYIGRPFAATIIPDSVSQPLPYIERALSAPIVYENRTFIPRALSGVYIPDTVMWVPRAMGATIQSFLLRSLTLAGVGTLAPTLSANTALSDTLAGIGTLTGTLSANTALAAECDGVGTLTGTLFAVSQPLPYIGRGLLSTIVYEDRTFIPRVLSGVYIPDTILPVPRALLSTIQATVPLSVTLAGVGTLTGTLSTTGGVSLSVTLAGVGTLTGTLSLTTALSTTLAGVGTLTGTMAASTALATSLAGVGTLSGTLSANLTLPTTSMTGVGTLTATLTAQTALTVPLAGIGTLAGVFSLRVALSLTFAGMGTLTGVISLPATSYLSAVWMTRDLLATWTSRDDKAGWTTRDEKAAWVARQQALGASWATSVIRPLGGTLKAKQQADSGGSKWTTRDGKTTWTTRK